MALVYVTCTASTNDHPYARRDYERLLHYASFDRIGKHSIVDRPEMADIVAFIGSAQPNFSDISRNKIFRKNKEKSLIFYSGDRAIPILPGVYTCLEDRHYISSRTSLQSGFYLRVTDNDSLDIDICNDESKYLFSFIGNAQNHPVREKICSLPNERAFLRDSSADARQQDDGIDEKNRERGILYRDVMAESKFILCPRGIGVSSWRLFETMRAGRVPVIISDDWIPPIGPKWNLFSIRIPEHEVHRIPSILNENEHKATDFGKIARKEWDCWYSKERVFNTVVDLLLLAKDGIASEGYLSYALTYTQYLDPFYFRHWLLSPLKSNIKKRITRRST